MHYYLVAVKSASQTIAGLLTYQSEEPLALGSIVVVPIRDGSSYGFIQSEVSKPKFATKPITSSYPDWTLTPQQLHLAAWLHDYYPAAWSQHCKLYLPPTIKKTTKQLAAHLAPKLTLLPELTHAQHAVHTAILASKSAIHWLHGDTGSGKTRVYIELAAQAIAEGKDVVLLVPEIGLSGQLVSVLQRVFGDRVISYHSNISEGPRSDIWYHLRNSGSPSIIIGPRSALFLPYKKLGLIIVDEAHDGAYKQDQQPRYQALPVAAKLATLHGATCIFGSATPNVADLWTTSHKHVPVHRMEGAAVASDHQTIVQTVDQTDRSQFSEHRTVSDAALAQIRGSLERGEQALIYLNRRGTARLIVCDACGWQATCPTCDLVLTYHHDQHQIRCHTCGYTAHMPPSCPDCGNADIIIKSQGTKAVVTMLQSLFSSATIARFDTDNTASERLERHIDELRDGDYDLIVGTQMIAKGLDLPRLSTVIVLQADVGLAMPDFRGEEKAFQQLLQVMGRVGRGHRAGSIVIQTHQPQHPVLLAASTSDWDTFYNYETKNRQAYRFPPFTYLAKLWVERKTQAGAQSAATKQANAIAKAHPAVTILGPTPAYYERGPHGYRWQLLVKSTTRSTLQQIVNELPANWQYDLDPDSSL
jgi:primosomal protein N' (replication factor Y)